jgi:hypothetical protein
VNDDYTTAINDSLSQRIISWTSDVLSSQDKLQAWIDSTESTANAKKEAALDELFGESKVTSAKVLVGKNGTIQWTDGEWQKAHDESKY